MSTVKTNNVQIGQSVTATNNFTWYQPASPDGTVRLGNGNSGSVTDLVTLTSAGNLGVGTSSPGYRLEVAYGSTSDALVITGSVDNITPYLSFKASNGGSSYIRGRVRGTAPDSTNGGLAFDTGASGSMSEKMRLDSSGNLGLGVTPKAWNSALRAIQVGISASIDSTISVANTRWSNNAFVDSSGGFKYINTAVAQVYEQDNNGKHVWRTAPSGTAGNAISFTQAMTLDASGNLLVGTTSKSSVVGVNSKFSAGLATLGNVTGGGTGAVDTGISINAGAAGGTILFLASRNVGAGTQTASAVYIITLYYDGNNAPSTTFVGGTNFCTFGVSGSNTLTVTNSGSGNASYSWFINK